MNQYTIKTENIDGRWGAVCMDLMVSGFGDSEVEALDCVFCSIRSTLKSSYSRLTARQVSRLAGKSISRKEAMKGLGNPKTWAVDKEKIDKEFKLKTELPKDYFKKEMATFKKFLPQMLAECVKGSYAVVCGDIIDYPFSDYDYAISFGINFYGVRKFMVKKIEKVETIQTN